MNIHSHHVDVYIVVAMTTASARIDPLQQPRTFKLGRFIDAARVV